MAELEAGGKTVALDESGFLSNPGDWDEAVACAIAEREGVEELVPERMEIINFLREYFYKFHAFPILRGVCRHINQPKDCVQEEFIDPMKAWKVAGLPNPGVIATESGDEEHKIFRFLHPG